MPRNETRVVSKEALKVMQANFRWFAGWSLRWRKIPGGKYRVTTLRSLWSHVDLRGLG